MTKREHELQNELYELKVNSTKEFSKVALLYFFIGLAVGIISAFAYLGQLR